MGKFIDLTGQRFGLLTVIERVFPNTKFGVTRWRCLCDCGIEVIRASDGFKKGKNQSCGCLLSKIIIENNKKSTIDLTGQRFGRWLVIERGKKEDKRAGGAYWLCKCDCGTEKEVSSFHLRNGTTLSCGCGIVTHGLSYSPIRNIHRHMLERCYDKSSQAYKNYGGRGIVICNEWLDIKIFHEWAMASGYEKGLTIERMDNNGPYSPENCKWATMKEQQKNRRNNIFLTLNGETKILSVWARVLNIPPYTIKWRLDQGKTVEEALSTLRYGKVRVTHE